MKQAYQWIIHLSKGPERTLTERQFAMLKKMEEDGGTKVYFNDFVISFPYIVQAYKEPASDELIKQYMCKKCGMKGFLLEKDKEGNWKTCPDCEGTGMSE